MRPVLQSFLILLTVAAVAVWGGGCGAGVFHLRKPPTAPAEVPTPALIDGRPMITDSDRPSELRRREGTREDTITLQMTFEVLRVDLPVLGIRHSLKIWNYVDETQPDPRLTALLARNGLRMGTGTTEVWPAWRVLFDANQAKSVQARHVVQSGAPLSLCLGEIKEGESLFYYRRDGRLVGQTFAGGTKFLHLDYALDPADPARTIIKTTPEVRKFSAEKHWENVDGRLQEVPRYEGRVFDDLSAELTVGPGEFLVIGPSESAHNPSLIGSQFLTTEENNVTYETVICVTPQVLRVERSGR
jgi:hypothetical protein